MAHKDTRNKTDRKRKEFIISLPQLVSSVKEDLIPKLIKEEDDKEREVIGRTITDRLTTLNTILRSRTLASDNTRRSILKLTGSKENLESFEGNLLSENAADEFIHCEQYLDELVIECVNNSINQLKTEKQILQESLFRREELLKEDEAQEGKRKEKSRTNSVSKGGKMESDADRVVTLESLIRKQESEINRLQRQIANENTDYVHIGKADFTEIMELIRPYVKQFSGLSEVAQAKTGSEKQRRKEECYSMSKNMKENVVILVEKLDKMKERVDQTIEKLKELEKEKIVCLKLLDKRYDEVERESLSGVLSDKIHEWQEAKDDFKNEIKSLRNNIESLAQRNRSLMTELEKASEEVKAPEPARSTPQRVRRSSAPPVKLVVNKKSEEKPHSKSTVGVMPKVFSFGDGSESPSASRNRKRYSSTTSNGPIKTPH